MAHSGDGIGLLGGSFDPVHNGHLAIAKSFLESGYISELWILPTPVPPHKTEKDLSNYGYRLEMLQAAFRDMDRVVISDIENKLSRPSYTVQTLKYLKKKYPDKKFYLCIGEDSVRNFKQWKDWEEILDYSELLVARRPSESELDLDPRIQRKTHFVTHEPVEISSTSVRHHISSNQDISGLVPEQVSGIIEMYNLYQNQ